MISSLLQFSQSLFPLFIIIIIIINNSSSIFNQCILLSVSFSLPLYICLYLSILPPSFKTPFRLLSSRKTHFTCCFVQIMKNYWVPITTSLPQPSTNFFFSSNWFSPTITYLRPPPRNIPFFIALISLTLLNSSSCQRHSASIHPEQGRGCSLSLRVVSYLIAFMIPIVALSNCYVCYVNRQLADCLHSGNRATNDRGLTDLNWGEEKTEHDEQQRNVEKRM